MARSNAMPSVLWHIDFGGPFYSYGTYICDIDPYKLYYNTSVLVMLLKVCKASGTKVVKAILMNRFVFKRHNFNLCQTRLPDPTHECDSYKCVECDIG